ncbi:MAG: hypothetical protein AAF405_06420 [Pseudomonadota bacterium]
MHHAGTSWFRPKRYGYGAEPKNWQGWLATALFALVAGAFAWFAMIAPALEGREVGIATAALLWGLFIAMTAGFVWLCYRKTDGSWRWRWGSND